MPTSNPASAATSPPASSAPKKKTVMPAGKSAGDDGQNVRADKHGDGRRRVGADRHETRVAERELAGVAVDQIQADGEDDVDADVDQHVEVVRIDAAREQPEQRTPASEPAKNVIWAMRSEQFEALAWLSDFFDLHFPSKPAGRKSRIKINTAKAMASRVGGETAAVDERFDQAEQ